VGFALAQRARESYQALRELVLDRNQARDLYSVPILCEVRSVSG
jgi:hypothetical protein